MLKIFTALVTAALIAGAVAMIPGMTQQVAASTVLVGPKVVTATKGDRLVVRKPAPNCAKQSWPYIDPACTRNSDAKPATPKQIRVVSTDRKPTETR